MSLSDCPSVCVGALRPATMRSGVICRMAYAVVFALVATLPWQRKHVCWNVAQPLSVPGAHRARGRRGGGLCGRSGRGACGPRRRETSFQRRARRRRGRQWRVSDVAKVCSDADLTGIARVELAAGATGDLGAGEV
jgi:hypothetical protein